MNTHNGHTRHPKEIEADLDRTRAQLGDTLDALQRKLSPGELFDQALGYVRASGGPEFTSNFKNSVAQNPVPVTLVGLGVAWLMLSGRFGGSARAADVLHAGARGVHRVGDVAAGARDKTSSAAHSARAGLENARTGLGNMASGGRERVHDLSHGARSGVARVSEAGRQGAARAKSGFDYMLNEQPLVLGAVGVALGALVAASLPRTQREDELMGDTRDEFVERARVKGEEQAEKARRIAASARDAARDEADKEGLNRKGGEAAIRQTTEKIERVADAALGAAEKEAKGEPSEQASGESNAQSTSGPTHRVGP